MFPHGPRFLEHPGPTNLKWDVVTPWDPENSSCPKGTPLKKTASILKAIDVFLFPTCQVRVVRFYVSLFSSSSRTPPPPPSSSCRDPVSSVWHAGPQPRSCEFSVACRTSTAIL